MHQSTTQLNAPVYSFEYRTDGPPVASMNGEQHVRHRSFEACHGCIEAEIKLIEQDLARKGISVRVVPGRRPRRGRGPQEAQG